MRAARWALLLAVAFALPAAWAGAAPQARQSVSPIVGDWSKDGYSGPVLRVGWEPRGLHGPKTAEIYADVLQDFSFFTGGCVHPKGERLFEVSSVAAWPGQFEGTGVVLNGDTATTSSCNSVGSKVTVSVGAYPSSAPPGWDLDICFTRSSGGTVCTSSLERAAAPGEQVTTAESPEYVAPGKYQRQSGAAVSFIVDAGGTFVNPVGRWIADAAVTAKLTCATWSPAKQKWLRSGTKVTGVGVPGRIAIGKGESVSATASESARRTLDRVTLTGTFTNWTHLRGTVRAVAYSTSAAKLPANPDKPKTTVVTRCDSGTLSFTAEHIPGSWQEIAGSRGG